MLPRCCYATLIDIKEGIRGLHVAMGNALVASEKLQREAEVLLGNDLDAGSRAKMEESLGDLELSRRLLELGLMVDVYDQRSILGFLAELKESGLFGATQQEVQ